MALVLKDRVKETTTSTGTGTITLAGAAQGFQSFSVIGNGNATYYTIYDPVTGAWEVGIGTYTASGTTLSRDTVLESSNSGSLVPFGAGVKDVFVTYPAERSVYLDTAGSAVTVLDIGTLGVSTANISSANITAGTISTTPTSSNDLVNKTYVDGIAAQGISYHTPVKYEVPNTTGNLNATYNQPGGPGVGVGATLTNAGTLAAFAPDGPTALIGDRILVYNQTNPVQNGVYTVTTVGNGSTPWVLTRASDADTYGVKSPTALGGGDAFFVTSGNTGAGETYVCNNASTITFGTTGITFAQIASAQVYSAGAGLTLSNLVFSITPVGTAGTYGGAASVPVFTTNAYGQITGVTPTSIAISGAAVSGNIAGSAGSVANALTAGAYLTATGTFDGSVARTFSVDATSANTASKVVARDASGNFSAGTITATLSGNATTATTATNIAGGAANQIVYQSGAGATTFVTAPTTSSTYLGWNGSAFTWSAFATPNSLTFNNGGAGGASGSTFNGSSALTVSYNTVGAPSTTGTNATGTWGISISGNAATATSATSATTATNLAGGSAGTVPYQSAAGTTAMLAAGTSGQYLQSNGAAAPSWATLGNGTLTMAVSGTGLSGSASFTANQSGNSTFTVTSNATNANTASTIVARDASGNFSAGTITANLTGTASNATSATTATNLAGGVAGAVPYQSGAGTTLFSAAGSSGQYLQSNGTSAPTWVTPPTIGNGTLTLAVSGTGLSGSQTFTANQSGNATFTVTSNATSANTASTIVARDASGNFSAGTITASLSGTATTATNWGAYGAVPAAGTSFGNANTIGRSDANGYTYFNYINSNTGNSENPTVGQVIVTNGTDNFYRKASIAHVTSAVQSNASGTWGISITGSAGSAGSVDYNNLTNKTGGTGTYTTSGDYRAPIFYDSGDTSYYVNPNSTSNLYVVQLLNGKWYPVDNNSGNSIDIYVRPDNNNTYVWRHIYGGTGTGYGTGVGGYGIYAQHLGGDYSLLFNPAGFVTAPYSFRSPIFYDSNNTAYYVDAASTSVLNALTLGGRSTSVAMFYQGFTLDANTMSSNATGFTYSVNAPYTGPIARFSTGSGGEYDLWLNALYHSNGYGLAFRTRNGDAATFNPWRYPAVYDVNANGGGALYATIYYDQSNTAYYVDPASASVLNSVSYYGVQAWVSDSVYALGTPTYGYRFNNNANTINAFIINNSGDTTSYASSRAPIFYDSNNTAYYVDPASTSEINKVYYNSNMVSRNYGIGQIGLYSQYRFQAVFSMGEAYILPADGTTTGNLYGIAWSYPTAGGAAANLASHGMLILENGGFQGAWGGGRLVTPSDIRGTIFYDYNNTGYYLDPNSTSYLYSLTLAGGSYFRPNNWIQLDGSYGLYWPNHYGAHLHANDLSTYTQIALRGGKNSYGGIFDQYSGVNGIMYDSAGNGGVYREASGRWFFYYSVANDCMGIGTSATSSTYSLYLNKGVYASSRIDATIFYDVDNTLYYVDPASTSRINTIQFDQLTSTAYNTPSQLVTSNDTNWAYGCFSDYSTQYWMQVKFYGTGDDNRGWRVLDSNGSVVRFRVNGLGNAIASGNVTAYSDERLKKDWAELPDDFIERLAGVKNGTYTRTDEDMRQVGVSAQSLQSLLPEAVLDGEYLSVAYGNAALAACVELAKSVVALRAEINALRAN